MESETKQSVYHSATYHAAGEAIMSFKPINEIHQHLCAFHVYSSDHSRHVEAHHYCKHLSKDFHQCVIYDSDDPNARLIGIEYIVSEKIFKSLPPEEKKFWHSHKYEVESGLLQLAPKSLVPGAATDIAEQPAMLELHQTYGKTIHTWAIDVYPDLPLGPPNLMMSYIGDGQGPPAEMVQARDAASGQDTAAKRELRKGYLSSYERVEAADEWAKTGRGVEFVVKEVPLKK
ncbi:DUF1264-domain-containing protein [Polyporus arcularius HHB13444]|uniref:DUF1264-domain-containing protein n=1 Tax=Polyporus arcularius HHB13444 TaxID=1314778 RepID=A0A5C3PSH5_9APHY|nr:DUF1264-domain-containing protein [Polyporus arcularius HHB13444]